MEIHSVDTFIPYYQRTKERTRRLFPLIPKDKIEWTYREGKFTFGDLIRHLAILERNMFAENACFKQSTYKGCGIEHASGLDNVIALYNNLQKESEAIFSSLSNEDLQKKTMTPAGVEITLWKWLRAMLEHEIHHRGQIYLYLNLLEIGTPPLFGLTAEQVAAAGK